MGSAIDRCFSMPNSREPSDRNQQYSMSVKRANYQSKNTNTNGSSNITTSNKLNRQYGNYQDILYVSTAQTGTCIFGNEAYELVLFDYIKGKELNVWRGHTKDITKTLYCPKINAYLTASRDDTVKLWKTDSDIAQMSFAKHTLAVTGIACNLENTLMISGSRDNCLILWDLQTGKSLLNSHINRNLVTDIQCSNDGKLLIQTGEDKETRLWDPSSLRLIHSFPKKQYIQTSCHLNSDSTYAISTSNGFQGNGCEITIWDLRKMSLLHEFIGHEQTVSCARFIQSDKKIISCSHDSTVRLWDVASLKLIHSEFHTGVLTSINEDKDGYVALIILNIYKDSTDSSGRNFIQPNKWYTCI